MAAPVIATKGTVATSSGTTSLSTNAPADVVSGDLLVLMVAAATTNTVDTPSNWDARATIVETGSGFRVALFDRIADGTADDTPAVSFGGASVNCNAVIYRLTGHHASDYYDSAATVTTTDSLVDTSHDIPTFDVAVDESLQIVLASNTSDRTYTWPVALAATTDQTTNLDLHVAAGERDAGTIAAETVTLSGGSRKAFASVVYKPAATGGFIDNTSNYLRHIAGIGI